MSSSLLELLRDILNRNIVTLVKKFLPIISINDNECNNDDSHNIDEYSNDDADISDILYYSSNHSDTLSNHSDTSCNESDTSCNDSDNVYNLPPLINPIYLNYIIQKEKEKSI